MGKSKRIRSDRAKLMVESPDKYEKADSARKAKITTIVLICVLVAIIAITVTLVVLDKTGTFQRAVIVYRSDNYKINAVMTTYLYASAYSSAYSQLGQYTSYYINQDYITTQAKSLLSLCEAARAAGVTLGEFEQRRIQESLDSIKSDSKKAGVSLSQAYGKGVTLGDIKDVLELQSLANKYQTQKQQSLTDEYAADSAKIDKYFEENKSTLLKGDYLSVSAASAEWRTALAAAKDADEFRAIFTKLYVTDNFAKTYNDSENLAADTEAAASLLESLIPAVADSVAYVQFGTKVEGVTLVSSSTVTADILKAIYEAKYASSYDKDAKPEETGVKEINDSIYTIAAAAAQKMNTQVKEGITEKKDYAYPNKSAVADEDYADTTTAETTTAAETTTGAEGETSAETTTAAQTTTAGATTAENTNPASPEELNSFDTWFFSEERKDNDIYTGDSSKVFFTMKAAKKDAELTKTVAHILVTADTATASDTSDSAAVSEANASTEKAFAEALPKAQSILDEFKAGEQTKEAFEALGYKYTQDSNVIYYNIKRDAMVDAFNDWIYDDARKAGDVDIVKTEYGYHIIYFIGNGLSSWQAEAVSSMVSEEITTWTEGLVKTYAVAVSDAGLKKVFG